MTVTFVNRDVRARGDDAAAVPAAVPGRRQHSGDAAGRVPAQRRDRGPFDADWRRATRRAGAHLRLRAGAGRPRRRARRPILSRRWRAAPIAAPVTDADVEPLLAFYREGRRQGGLRRRHRARRAPAARQPRVPVPRRARSGRRRPGHGLPRSAISSSPRGCRSSSGAAFRTTSCWTWRRSGSSARRRCSTAQVRADARRPAADAFVTNFAGQWLFLRNLRCRRCRCRASFPDFDDSLRQAFRRETELFFDSIVREDRSALDLLRADYTFLNERLARHYGIPNVKGSHFRRVDARPGQPARRPARPGQHPDGDVVSRSHLAGGARQVDSREPARHAAAAAAAQRRRSEADQDADGAVLSMRERMAQHRANPVCASCHSMMDPLGLSLENFDAVGKWRTLGESSAPIDASRRAARRHEVRGPGGLRDGAAVARTGSSRR